MVSGFTWVPKATLHVFRACAVERDSGGKFALFALTLCRHIGQEPIPVLVYCSVRDWTRFLRHRIKYIRIHPSTRYRIRCGFIFFHSGPVHKLSYSFRIYFFPLWRADLFFSGFAVEFAGYVLLVAVSGKKKLLIRKYPDTCGRGLRLLAGELGLHTENLLIDLNFVLYNQTFGHCLVFALYNYRGSKL